ncbi:branched-chain amino acid ABC transporter ATP-binding protein/permease [Pimelobacter simplex]|uniref:Branched-chain amino acid transport ATP-binding protein LivG n=3 Tax=Nocardioides simplex TaxID=2045 RepID=A0A0C5XBV5_NOCSI|nr:branched-chain amino acid ABC transporter ATP-binding protein/permease [Pimelobacter simplex]AJR18790.1 Branched-chain amino acid transport ATP-binding protein LivG [Pimelobacter simplex]GEB16546.1 branched-chain amino acid ABC transporter permease [Pimelobacter simplex]SFM20533.1 branched-chain amino acid transport system permease protein [Pimelobacter simplex]
MAGLPLARRIAAGPLWLVPLAAGILLILVPYFNLEYSIVRQLQLAMILSLLVSGLNLSLGFAGELALGQVAMYAAGAYTAGMLSQRGHTDIVLQLVAAGVAALLVGILTGIPGLRLGSWSLAMTSFFLVLLLPDVLAIFREDTGGRNGLTGILSPTLFGRMLTPEDYFMVIAIVTVAWFAVMRNIAVSRHGTALRVLKQSPVLAASMGINVFRMKLMAYALGAVPAGLAGALFASLDLYISPEAFSFTVATTILAASVLGGSASVYGAVFGAFILQFGLNQSTEFQRYSLVVTGAFLIIGGVLLTGGLSGLARSLWKRAVGEEPAAAADKDAARPDEVPAVPGKVLKVEGVAKSFGGNQALKGVDLVASPGKVTALIGPNGSGKTTLLNMICGFYRTDAGVIALDDRQLQRMGPDRVARTGVARTFQTPNIPEGITVREAVMAGRYAGHRATVLEAVLRLPRYRKVRRADLAEADRVLDLVGIRHLEDAEATALPLGQRRLLEVARCLISNPGVLLLDETASGLDEDEVERLAEVIRRVRDAGGTVVLVEHNFQLVLSLADEIVALAHGELMAKGTPEEIQNNERVMSEYLGIDPDAPAAPHVVLADVIDGAQEGVER